MLKEHRAEKLTSVVIAVSTFASSIKSVGDFAVDSLGLGGAFLPALTSLAVFGGCLYIVRSEKPPKGHPGRAATATNRAYTYDVWMRRFGKLVLLLMVFVIPMNVITGVEQTMPLPLSVAGVLFDADTREPVEGARIRLSTSDRVDVTRAGEFASDSRGVFVVATNRHVRRSAIATVFREGCKPVPMALWKRFETPVPAALQHVDKSTSPFFTFYAVCDRSDSQ